MKDYIYLGIIAVMFVVFLILHIKQNNRITKLMSSNWRKLPADG